jgi:hypothetical protein
MCVMMKHTHTACWSWSIVVDEVIPLSVIVFPDGTRMKSCHMASHF